MTRAVVDTSRLIPFTVFAVIPFSEFALPFVLKVWFPPLFIPEIPQLSAVDVHVGVDEGGNPA